MGTLRVNSIVDAAGTGAPNIPDGIKIGGVALASVTTMQYASQSSEPSAPKNGAIWWNPSTLKYNVYMNGKWVEVQFTERTLDWYGDRAVFSYGINQSSSSNMDYVRISVLGNAAVFGTMSNYSYTAGCSNSVRGVFAGGTTGGSSIVNSMEYITFGTLGNTTSFGSITGPQYRSEMAGFSDSSRGVFGGGVDNVGSVSASINYITIATLGDTTSFGSLTQARRALAGFSNRIYGVFAGGSTGTPVTTADYITIATTGNATAFGNLGGVKTRVTGTSSPTIGVVIGGYNGSSFEFAMEYFTINTPGNATNFGDLPNRYADMASTSNGVRGVIGGGYNNITRITTISYITFATPGNAVDFGSLTVGRNSASAVSGNY